MVNPSFAFLQLSSTVRKHFINKDFMTFRRNVYGYCKICMRYKKLTDDHVPPKGGINLEPVEINKIYNHFVQHYGSKKYYISQNGVKFKTICAVCNSRLGTEFDRVLNNFALGIGKYVKSKLYLPNVIKYETEPNALMRAVLGHLLAVKSDDDSIEFDQKVRDILFEESKPIPDDINVFYWVYPFNLTVIIRDIAMPSVRGRYNDIGLFNILKFSPVAFLVTNLKKYEGLNSLNRFKKFKFHDKAEIEVKLNEKKHYLWPEHIEDGNFTILSKAAVDSIHAKNRDRKR